MLSRQIIVNSCFERQADTSSADGGSRQVLRELLAGRLSDLSARTGDHSSDIAWDVRRFPVLAALAPVMTSAEGEITYPGDPMCLYAALSVVVDNAITSAREGAGETSAFADLCPDWATPPSEEQRMSAEHGIRPWHEQDSCTDHTVFDPRIWDDTARDELRAVLRQRQPRVFLVSTVSPGHRYALEMATIVKQELPTCLVVFGGRHMDETVKYEPASRTLVVEYSSTLRAVDDGRVEAVVDFLVAGEGYYALDVLMRAIALAMDLDRTGATVADVIDRLDILGKAGADVPGTSLICAVTPEAVTAFPVRGRRFDLAYLPSPYQGFAIRARFPIFPRPDGGAARTAHMTVSNACPYHCDFCSESALLVGGLKRFGDSPAATALERVCEYVSYGAEAVFFDDSIFWSGSFPAMMAFCEALRDARAAKDPQELPEGCRKWIRDCTALARLKALQFGCQLTVDLVTTLHKERRVRDTLGLLRESGCTYIYVGIESMSAQVMQHVHKNVRHVDGFPWKAKVREALERIRDAKIPVGSSVLFGLEGENRQTIEETIEEVGLLIDAGLLIVASPNILTYHPATPITRDHGMADRLDYHSPDIENRAPYTYFEEAFPEVVSQLLTESDIWFIHDSTAKRWGVTRNAAEA
ncbi:radical SAM superfamily enzyme YgiQ (UPF0313 family) [Catenulispora sp. GAS73]|uniref:B12-binding domain-containing radical SAM protein n=1 Tax=Catenulispora sp. GAS73 TaxID=3156269 RepID=UPI0035120017